MSLNIKNKLNSKIRFQDKGHTTVYDLINQTETGVSTVDLVVIEIAPGQHSLNHYHPGMHELFYLLKGQIKILVNGEEGIMNPGDAIIVDPEAPRFLHNLTDQNAEVIIVCSPAYHKDCSVFLEK